VKLSPNEKRLKRFATTGLPARDSKVLRAGASPGKYRRPQRPSQIPKNSNSTTPNTNTEKAKVYEDESPKFCHANRFRRGWGITRSDGAHRVRRERERDEPADHTDAWNHAVNVPVGAVYLRRVSGNSVEALNVVCPHAGCFVDYVAKKNGYLCPCHNSLFALNGRIADPKSPSSSPLNAMKKNRRRLKFEQWFLLAVRCLVLGLLGLALARPGRPASAGLTALPPGRRAARS
jgi:Rieske Fe-S protein